MLSAKGRHLGHQSNESPPMQAKYDMVAFKELRGQTPEKVVGAIPGIPPGVTLNGKGELAILGIHCAIVAGIYSM